MAKRKLTAKVHLIRAWNSIKTVCGEWAFPDGPKATWLFSIATCKHCKKSARREIARRLRAREVAK